MKEMCLLFVLLFTFSGGVFSQKSLSDFNYVVVPQQFEFQKETDQYQVNTLIRHLLRESGFNSIYGVELRGMPRCDGLFVDLINDSNFIRTSITVVLKDCNDSIIYMSEKGISREKDYKKGYHEAIRRAFSSIEILGVQQGNMDAFRDSFGKRNLTPETQKNIEVKPEKISENQIKDRKLTAYSHNGSTFFLEAKEEGYVLYEKLESSIIKTGTLSKTSRADIYFYNSNNGKSMLASFDTDNNLIIDTEDSEGNTSQNVFILVKQE